MSAHIDTTYVANALGSTYRDALTDTSTATLTQLIQHASALVDAALGNSGYSSPTSAPDLVKGATMAALLPMLYGRKDTTPPETLTQVYGTSLQMIIDGSFPIPGMTPSGSGAVGGVDFTTSDPDQTDAVEQIFGARDLF